MKHGTRGNCSQCGATGAWVCFYLGQVWCMECRAVHQAQLPPLPDPVKISRPEVTVTHEGKVYEFASKSEARSVMRNLLEVKRLPSSIVAQIEGVVEASDKEMESVAVSFDGSWAYIDPGEFRKEIPPQWTMKGNLIKTNKNSARFQQIQDWFAARGIKLENPNA